MNRRSTEIRFRKPHALRFADPPSPRSPASAKGPFRGPGPVHIVHYLERTPMLCGLG